MKSKGLKVGVAVALGAMNPSVVHAATLRIAGIVPVSCGAEFVSGTVSNRRLTITVRRSCNTFHTIMLRGGEVDALGNIQVRYNGNAALAMGGDTFIDQPDRYYDGVDQLTIEASQGDDADLMQYASSLRIELETT